MVRWPRCWACSRNPWPRSKPPSSCPRDPVSSAAAASIAARMMTVHAPIGALLGGLFLVAGVGKLARRDAFARALAGYRLARPKRPVAWMVPAAEVAVGAALVAGFPAAGWAALAMLAVFSLALGVE